jgi:hypothetical protein
MVKTRTEVKLKIGEWIIQQDKPFTTEEVKQVIQPQATNISLSPNRLTKYIRATRTADYDPKNGNWKKRLTPFQNIQED